MAAEGTLVRQGVASGISVSLISLLDRRSNAPSEPTVWAFQREIEAALYGNDYASGAVYRLLHRREVGARSLPLKKACIADDLITESEFEWIHDHLGGGVRSLPSFTLIPLDALQTAIETYGCDERSEALIQALELERPESWGEGEEDDGEDRARRARRARVVMVRRTARVVMARRAARKMSPTTSPFLKQ
eukprot:963190-Prymnesium_polylepis.2